MGPQSDQDNKLLNALLAEIKDGERGKDWTPPEEDSHDSMDEDFEPKAKSS